MSCGSGESQLMSGVLSGVASELQDLGREVPAIFWFEVSFAAFVQSFA